MATLTSFASATKSHCEMSPQKCTQTFPNWMHLFLISVRWTTHRNRSIRRTSAVSITAISRYWKTLKSTWHWWCVAMPVASTGSHWFWWTTSRIRPVSRLLTGRISGDILTSQRYRYATLTRLGVGLLWRYLSSGFMESLCQRWEHTWPHWIRRRRPFCLLIIAPRILWNLSRLMVKLKVGGASFIFWIV